MADGTGSDLPPRTSPGKLGSRWLGVIPIAQGAIIGEVLVQLVALEHRSTGSLLTARISRLEEEAQTQPRNRALWPRLRITARDDIATVYFVDGGPGMGSDSDRHVEYGPVGDVPGTARHLNLIITELTWEDLETGKSEAVTSGQWTFTVDLTRELSARLI